VDAGKPLLPSLTLRAGIASLTLRAGIASLTLRAGIWQGHFSYTIAKIGPK